MRTVRVQSIRDAMTGHGVSAINGIDKIFKKVVDSVFDIWYSI